jgi:pSer/pThr/pTyr-binding forkhead associated (FHA) protein
MKLRIKGRDQIFSHDSKQESTSIGRSSDNDFVIPLDDFSRKHCVVTFKGNYAFIMDCGSKNGVTIDGARIEPNRQYPIYANSRVVIANLFEFILPDGTSVKDVKELELALEEPRKRRR